MFSKFKSPERGSSEAAFMEFTLECHLRGKWKTTHFLTEIGRSLNLSSGEVGKWCHHMVIVRNFNHSKVDN